MKKQGRICENIPEGITIKRKPKNGIANTTCNTGRKDLNTQRNTTKERKCNNDCFNCQYEDCILEEQDFPTGQHGQYKDKEKRKAYMREYFKKNGHRYRETWNKAHRTYYAKHREELLAKAKEKYRKQKEDKEC